MSIADKLIQFKAMSEDERESLRAQWAGLKKAPSLLRRVAQRVFMGPSEYDALEFQHAHAIGYASLIQKSMRFKIDDDVWDAVRKMSDIPDEQLFSAYEHAIPPYESCWIEAQENIDNNESSSNASADIQRYGFLIQQNPETQELNFRYALMRGSDFPYVVTERSILTKDGRKSPNLTGDLLRSGHIVNFEDGLAKKVFALILILNSRSKVLEIGEPEEDFSRLNRKRERQGKQPKPELNVIKFDISRLLKKDKNLSQEEAQRIQAESLVRGHFKLRKTGVFWWSFHFRNKDADTSNEEALERQLPRERKISLSGAAETLQLPHNDQP